MSYRLLTCILVLLYSPLIADDLSGEQWDNAWFLNNLDSNGYYRKIARKNNDSWDKLLYLSLIEKDFFPDSLSFNEIKSNFKTRFLVLPKLELEDNTLQIVLKIQNSTYNQLEPKNIFLAENYIKDQGRLLTFLKTNKYNCVSSSLLYMIILSYFNIKTYGVLENNHSYLVFQADSSYYSIETTANNVINPFNISKKKKNLLSPIDFIAQIMKTDENNNTDNSFFYPYIEVKSRLAPKNESAQSNCLTAYLSLFHRLLKLEKTETLDSFLVYIDPYYQFVVKNYLHSKDIHEKINIYKNYKGYYLDLKARKAGEKRNWRKALSLYSSILEQNLQIDSAHIHNNMAISYLNWGIETKNKPLIEKSIELACDKEIIKKAEHNLHLLEIEDYINQKKYHKAKDIFNKYFTSHDPEYKDIETFLNKSCSN